MTSTLRNLVVLWLSLLASVCTAANAPQFKLIAVEGQQAPGAPEGHAFRDLYLPTITQNGQIVFQGTAWQEIYGETTIGIWIDRGTGPELEVSNRDELPGLPAGIRMNPLPVQLHDNGTLLIAGELNGPGVFRELSVWQRHEDELKLLARQEEMPPETAPYKLETVFGLNNNAAGQALFFSDPQFGPSTMWIYENGDRRILAKEFGPPPHDPSRRIDHLPTGATIDADGNVTMMVGLDTLGAHWQLLRGTPDALTVILAHGDPVPGIPGATFRSAGPQSNPAGEIAFVGSINTPQGPLIETGIWAGQPHDLQLVARAGERAPGTPTEWVFNDNFYPALNNAGDVGFITRILGPGVAVDNNTALYRWRAGQLEFVVQAGSQPPGLPDGYIFRELLDFKLNDAGQMIFLAYYTAGAGTTEGFGAGYWSVDPSGIVHPLLVGGEEIEVAPGEVRKIYGGNGLSASSGAFRSTVFNNAGTFITQVAFDDRRKAIVAIQVPIPEPGPRWLVGTGFAAMGIGSRGGLWRRR